MLTLALLALACRNSDKVIEETGDSGSSCVPAEETCDGLDNDCDEIVDEDAIDMVTYYWDNDQDTYGAGEPEQACTAPLHSSETNDDCDDDEGQMHPGRTEVCDGLDNDCDGEVDPVTSQGTQIHYSDNDGDGYGTGEGDPACDPPPDTSTESGDCDDDEASTYPGATDTWYDGVDSDCAGDSDYDADVDGADSSDWGGSDCLDDDPSVTECRPAADCTHPSAALLQAGQLNISSDLAFDLDCSGWVSGIRSGTDYTYWMDGAGNSTTIVGYSNFNQQAVAISPINGDAVISHNDNSRMGLGYVTAGTTTVSDWLRGTLSNGTLWPTSYFNRTPSQLSWDSSGCIWAPGFVADGTLSCVDETAATTTDVITGLAHIEAVALDNSEQVYISVGDQVLLVDTTAGTTTLVHTASADVLSLAFDPWNGDLYVSTTAPEIEQVPADGSAPSVWQPPASQARIAISPDGWLVALSPETGTFEEWELPAY